MRRLFMLGLGILGFYAAPAAAEPARSAAEAEVCEGCEALLEAALAHPRREGDRARDPFRNPAETLSFFRVRPGTTVIDYMPASGWYTRVLVPYLGTDGRYIGLNPALPADAAEGMRKYMGGLREKFPAAAANWKLEGATVEAFNTDELGEERNGTVDRVLIFREMHNLRRNGLLQAELTRLYHLLKPEGLLGIVQHRARPDAPAAYTDGSKGYMREKDVIGLVEAYGFELVEKSEINANPKDSADHPAGVWELPPAKRTKRDELDAIGESDRMTLLFRKR
jgi:predicted methyltransferase